ncbi:Hsp33 family molecular chaperone HslO [Finegoldia magna]|uniref:Hsp33 family molecular chaperone HslO n=1 Tax=Finegoldia magna TaxID=1260 RepID=UPI00044C41D0|nr:Hsp33 family molecular chaperone HslO [Finegoldia magna]EXF26859.1 heat shock protein Hsp33 [Finegoldia magna ALB8]MDU1213513.1 Hsp33 family molecular chaperone HslO [Finegoldia magna]MDU4732319.1 Hsp33 family molecular chaperone HslO [Finegoldia magna]MDU5441530.1 Hsp33 family molecular chaperone HslO [Finegoldia magna]MDU5742623.1 Hsp33 family molecular chaperone HslO [Finegoldia magna]
MINKLYIATDSTESFRFIIVDSTDLVQSVRNIHNTSATASAALGRLSTMAAIMSHELKNESHNITLNLQGNGQGGMLISTVNGRGEVKSYVSHPEVDLPTKSNKKLDVGSFVGNEGLLTVIKDFKLKEPYIGQTSLVSGEIAEDFSNYFYQSDQRPTVVALGVLVDTDLSIKSAGGLFIQALPGFDESLIDKLESDINKFPPISSLFVAHDDPFDILNQYFSDFDLKLLGKKEVQYLCDCNRDRVERSLISLGKQTLTELIEEDGKAELVCDFCNKKYNFSKEELMELRDNL